MTLCSLVLVSAAWATVPDKYGAGARSMGSGGGGVAMVEDGNAAYVNPAGLGRIRTPTASLGFSTAVEQFTPVPDVYWDTNRDGVLDDRDDPLRVPVGVRNPSGLNLTAGRQIGGKFGLGIYAYLPPSSMMRFATFEPDLPNYFMYSNRPLRYVASAGVGGEIVRGVNLGVAVDFVPRVHYDLFLTLDAELTGDGEGDGLDGVVGDVRIDVHEMALDVIPDFAPIFGVQLELGRWVPALDGLVLGAALRGSVGLPIDVDLDLQANIALEDIGDLEAYVVPIILKSGLLLFDHYVPTQLTVGLAYRTDETLSAYLDVRWTDWRPMIVNVAKVVDPNITSPLLDLNDFVTDGNAYDLTLRSVWSLRMGTELRLPRWELANRLEYLRVTVRGGFGYEPTPLVGQGASSAFLDSDRTMFTLGLGAEMMEPLKLTNGPVRFDLYFQYHVLARGNLPRQAAEPTPGYPVSAASVPIGGHIAVFGAEWGFDY